MKPRPDGFLNPGSPNIPEALDYIRELHEILWACARALNPGRSGSLSHFLDGLPQEISNLVCEASNHDWGPPKYLVKHHPRACFTSYTTEGFRLVCRRCGYHKDVWVGGEPVMGVEAVDSHPGESSKQPVCVDCATPVPKGQGLGVSAPESEWTNKSGPRPIRIEPMCTRCMGARLAGRTAITTS